MRAVNTATARQRTWSHAHSLTAKGVVSCFKDDPTGLFNLPPKAARDQCHVIDTGHSHCAVHVAQGIQSCCLPFAPVSWRVYPGRLNRTPEPLEGWYSVLSWSLIHPFNTAVCIDRNIYDVWLRGYNGVREHNGANWKGRGKCTLKHISHVCFFCSQKSAIALILGRWGKMRDEDVWWWWGMKMIDEDEGWWWGMKMRDEDEGWWGKMMRDVAFQLNAALSLWVQNKYWIITTFSGF